MGIPGSTLTNQVVALRRAAILAVAVLPVSVGAIEPSGYWYAGAGVGHSYSNGKNQAITTATGLCPAFPCTGDRNDTGYKLLAGYQFNARFGLEGEYTRLPNTLSVQSIDNTAVPTATLRAAQDSNIFSLRGVLSQQVTAPLSISGALGVSLWQSDMEAMIVQGGAVAAGAADSESTHGLSLSYGVRINYDFDDNIRLRGSWDRYTNLGNASAATILRPGQPLVANTVHTDTDLFSLEFVYRFR